MHLRESCVRGLTAYANALLLAISVLKVRFLLSAYMNLHTIHDFKELKQKVREFYRSIGKVKCPALDADVFFTSDGFHHLRYDNNRSERSKEEQRNKLSCLKEAVDIISRSTTIQEYRTTIEAVGKPDRSGFRKTTTVEFYAFSAITDADRSRRFRVIVKKIGSGNYHFWSLMPEWTQVQINSSQAVRFVGSRKIIDK